MNGLTAVHVFFIISGFYMALILIEKYAKSEKPYFTFITNRLLRIYPMYWIILLLMIYVDFSQIQSINIKDIVMSIPHAATHYLGDKKLVGTLSDITLLVRPDYFNIDMFRAGGYPLISPAWSLVLELCFYLVAPVLVFLKKKYLFFLCVVSWIIYF